MRIALTGASGFIGSVFARRAAAHGHEVVAQVRRTSRRDHLEDVVSRFVEGDQADASVWPDLLDGVDAVVASAFDWEPLKSTAIDRHLRANVLAPLEFLRTSGPRPFVYLSTIAVHHEMLDRWGGTIDEDHPARPGGLYGAAKVAVEAHMHAEHAMSGRHVTSLRPCAVYGIDPRPTRTIGWPILERVRAGTPFSRAGGGKFVHVDDVAAAMMASIEKPEASGQVYNLVDCYARWSDWAHIIAEEAGVEDAVIDDSSPAAPKNTFDVDAVRALVGSGFDRGLDGIRTHVREMIAEADRITAEA